jgi:hypothetical protein
MYMVGDPFGVVQLMKCERTGKVKCVYADPKRGFETTFNATIPEGVSSN